MSVVKVEDLISEFIDLLNEHGTDSQEIKDFMWEHRGDRKLIKRLRKAATHLKIMFEAGELE
ncbi:MAG: hypothetical protein HQ536_03685 [Parcubacteria group bacterium]|nr:hypothetical protein [Parcubacteria group bacterium]